MSQSISPQDVEVTSPPTDGITDLAFSPQADLLAVSSWDEQVRVYDVQPTGATQPKALYAHPAPVFSIHWSQDGSKIVSGGADSAARLFDSTTGQAIQVAQHDAPVKQVKFLNGQQPVVVTGSWDKTIKYWDLRTSQPIGTVQLPERCHAMDTSGSTLVVGTAGNQICIIDLQNPTVIAKQRTTPLKMQLRSIACFDDGKGYATGSIEGRIAINYVEDKNVNKQYTFRCHREDGLKKEVKVFAVNQIKFHPLYGTFATCGSDGGINFWDGAARQRLKPFPRVKETISCMSFNRNGTILAYAQSYDWSKGHKFANTTNRIFLHAVKDEDIKQKSGTSRQFMSLPKK